MLDINAYLQYLCDKGGSDLHVKAGGPAYVRVHGELSEIHELPMLSPADTADFAQQLMDPASAERFRRGSEADFAYNLPGVGRFRVAVFRQRGSVGIVLRLVLPGNQGFDELGLPAAVRKLAEEQRGLVLVTGPTGSGKTTTTAAMLGHINATRRCHIVSIEDPIEILHRDNLAIIDQREIGIDTADFATAMRSVARQDPDVIFIGEMRDPETMSAALQAAETGHLVISTLHTTNATDTVNRVIDVFPPHQQGQARLSLANSLRGVVSQRLLPGMAGGRVAVIETLVMTTRLYEFLIDPEKTDHIETAIAEGQYYGMQTFDQHLLALYRDRIITLKDALHAATNAHDLRVAIRAAGLEG